MIQEETLKAKKQNVIATHNLIEATGKSTSRKKIVIASTTTFIVELAHHKTLVSLYGMAQLNYPLKR
jgi:hypothetical protein